MAYNTITCYRFHHLNYTHFLPSISYPRSHSMSVGRYVHTAPELRFAYENHNNEGEKRPQAKKHPGTSLSSISSSSSSLSTAAATTTTQQKGSEKSHVSSITRNVHTRRLNSSPPPPPPPLRKAHRPPRVVIITRNTSRSETPGTFLHIKI